MLRRYKQSIKLFFIPRKKEEQGKWKIVVPFTSIVFAGYLISCNNSPVDNQRQVANNISSAQKIEKDDFAEITLDLKTTLPIVIIDKRSQFFSYSKKINTNMRIIYNEGGENSPQNKANIYDGFAGVEFRGHFEKILRKKKSYSMETRDSYGENLNVSILGMPEENDWILHPTNTGSFHSLFKNIFPYEIYRQTNQYTPKLRFVELIIDDKYQGIYTLMERIKRDNNRIAIKKMQPSDVAGDKLTGGWLFRVRGNEGYLPGAGWTGRPSIGKEGSDYQFIHPDKKNIVPEQKAYIEKAVGQVEDRFSELISTDIKNLEDYIDIDSWIAYAIVIEMSGPTEFGVQETFLYKNRDSLTGSKLFMGPPWDLDNSLGKQSHWLLMNGRFKDSKPKWSYRSPWIYNVYSAPQIHRAFKNQWQTFRKNKFSDSDIEKIVNDFFEPMTVEVLIREANRWYPDLSEEEIRNTWRKSFVERITQVLKQRADWVDNHISELKE